MSKFSTLIVVVLFSFISIQGATYYVDQVNGNNSNSGLTTGSAWKSITKINSFSFKPGDNILFKSGQLWREKVYFTKPGSDNLPITFGSYGEGSKPIISGADLISGFTNHSGSVYKKTINITYPQQVFFNNIRGTKKTSLAAVVADKDWFYDATGGKLYIYSSVDPGSYNAPGIEASSRDYAFYINSDYVDIKDLQVEKTSQSAINISGNADVVNVDNVTFLQWTNEENVSRAGLLIIGRNCSVRNSTFGKNTGDDLGDQKWSGYLPIALLGNNGEISNNFIYHNAVENESSNGNFAYGIRVALTSGTTRIFKNYIYHTGSNSIYLTGYSVQGDAFEIYDNVIEYPGQAGISAFKTRSNDGIGGKGYVYRNKVTFANRLGGDIGGNGNQSAGIHFNDGIRTGTQASKPFMKWYCYENSISNSQALMIPNGPDSDGIALDFNAHNVEVFRNIMFNNYGKGIYAWNANNCKVYYNIIYGNDAGCTVSASAGGVESANNNEFYNNTFYINYNGNDKGSNLNSEIYFGGNGNNNIFKNNILYASANGFGYYFANSGSSGCITDNNLVYSEAGTTVNTIGYDTQKGRQTFTQWKANHPGWDLNSICADPGFVNALQADFSLSENSPAINRGTLVNLNKDYSGKTLTNIPDIGAFEYFDTTPPHINSVQLVNDVTLKVSFSEVIDFAALQSLENYFISDGVTIISASALECSTKVLLTTSIHNSGSFTLQTSNIRDAAGNIVSSEGGSASYSYTAAPIDTIIVIPASEGALSGSASLKIQPGSLSSNVVYFTGTDGSVKFNVNLPKSGNWYAWARLYYANTSTSNSFTLTSNGVNGILGDAPKYNLWHYDGYRSAAINLGSFVSGQNEIIIAPGEPGETLVIDQIILTPNPDYIPQDEPSVLPAVLSYPTDNSVNQPVNVTLNWNRDVLASAYELQVASDPAFTNVVYSNSSVTDTFMIINNVNYGEKYFWRVTSYNNILRSDWSSVWNFTCKPKAVISAPANNSMNLPINITLNWEKAQGDSPWYILQVAGDSDFNNIVINDTVSIDTFKTINYLQYGMQYYWRVRSVNSAVESEWSDSWTFSCMGIVELAEPVNNTTETPLEITLSWNKKSEATAYDIQVSRDSAFTSLVVCDSSANDTVKTISGLEYGAKYFWRVKFKNSNSESDWTQAWNFTCIEGTTLLLRAMDGTLSGDARLGTMTGQKSTRSVYFQGYNGGTTLNVNIPETGRWYIWARMYYMSSGGKNSFFITVNGTQYTLGDDDTKYNKWHWDGYMGAKIDAGILNAGNNVIKISGREPGLTLWVDQIVLTNNPNYNPYISLGKTIVTSAENEIQKEIPTSYELSQNFPNPFNPSTKMRFSLPESGHTTLKIYDILGKEVAELVNSDMTAGYHEIIFNASNLASGVYIYQLKTSNYTRTLKMQLLK